MRYLSTSQTPLNARPTLYLTVGLPGAGKTTRAIELETRHNALRLTLDAWMIQIFAGVNDDKSRDLLEGQIIALALHALQFETDVILDFGLWSRNERSALRYLADAVGANSELVYLAVDRETQIQRVTARYESTPEQTFAITEDELDRWREYFEEPDDNELMGASLDEPPAGVTSWSEWASKRWPSFHFDRDVLQLQSPTVRADQSNGVPTLTLFCGLPGSGKNNFGEAA